MFIVSFGNRFSVCFVINKCMSMFIIIIQIFIIFLILFFSFFFSKHIFCLFYINEWILCMCNFFSSNGKSFLLKNISIDFLFFFFLLFLLVRNNVRCDKNSSDGYFYDSAIVERKRWKTCLRRDVISFSTCHFQRMRSKSAGLTKHPPF